MNKEFEILIDFRVYIWTGKSPNTGILGKTKKFDRRFPVKKERPYFFRNSFLLISGLMKKNCKFRQKIFCLSFSKLLNPTFLLICIVPPVVDPNFYREITGFSKSQKRNLTPLGCHILPLCYILTEYVKFNENLGILQFSSES